MAREQPIRSADSRRVSDEGRGTNALERRSYLKLIGASAVAGGALASTDTARATSSDLDVADIDYADYYDGSSRYNGLSDVYRVWNQRSNTDPEISADRAHSGDRCVAHHLDGNQMSANTVYPLEDHYGGDVDELYQRFYVHPNGMWLSENNTMRFFWIGLRNGSESSGAGWNPPHSGADGWSVRAGFTRRQNHSHPDTYTFFVYSYDMRLDSHDIPSIEYGNRVQVPMDEWVKIETYQKLNSYDASGPNWDGELRVWVNDELAYENDGLAWRSTGGQGIEEAGPHGYDLYQDNNPHTLYFDDHVLVVNGDREDWQEYKAGNGVADDDEVDGEDTGYENEFAIVTEDGADRVSYRFVTDGTVEFADLGTSPSGDPIEGGGNDEITELEDGFYEVEGLTGNGWGDGFVVNGEVVEFEAENRDSDADPEYWLEWNGEEVTVEELLNEDDSTDDTADDEDDSTDDTADDEDDSTDDTADDEDDSTDDTADDEDDSTDDTADDEDEEQPDWFSNFFDRWSGSFRVYIR